MAEPSRSPFWMKVRTVDIVRGKLELYAYAADGAVERFELDGSRLLEASRIQRGNKAVERRR